MSKAAPADKGAQASGSKKKMLIFIILGVVLLISGIGAGAFFMGRGGAHESKSAHVEKHEGDKGDDSADAGDSGDGGDDADEESFKKKKPAQYLSLDPAFVVNLQDDQAMRYLQIEAQVMTRDPKAIEHIKSNMPVIRNVLLLLFSQQHAKDLVTREGKEELQKEALQAVRKAMREETGSSAVQAIYFTSFVLQ